METSGPRHCLHGRSTTASMASGKKLSGPENVTPHNVGRCKCIYLSMFPKFLMGDPAVSSRSRQTPPRGGRASPLVKMTSRTRRPPLAGCNRCACEKPRAGRQSSAFWARIVVEANPAHVETLNSPDLTFSPFQASLRVPLPGVPYQAPEKQWVSREDPPLTFPETPLY